MTPVTINGITYPYSDDFMKFDDVTNHYVLTEQAMTDWGFALREQVEGAGVVNPENALNGFFRIVSDTVYSFIHRYSTRNQWQDEMIAQVPELRPIIYRAMIYQAVYMYYNGNLSISTKPEERNNAIDMTCQDILNTVIPCLGTSILYAGC